MPAPPQPGVDFYGRDPWEAFSSNADGTNDYLTITPSITNAKSFHYRCWIHPKGDGTERVLVANDNAANVGIRIILTTTNQLQVVLRNAAGTTILDATSLSNGYIDAMGMGTIDINVDLNATTYQMLWNGFDDSPITPATAPVNDTIDFGGNWAFWADPDGTQPFNGDVSQVFAIFGQTYIDLDTDSNWAKFVEDAALRPANLGYNGARPYSAAPEFFLPMDPADPGQNWGSESDLTEVGAFTAGTLTPLNFVFRLPLTDFPDTGGEYLQTTTNFAADANTLSVISHHDHDVNGVGDKIVSFGSIGVANVGSGTPANNNITIEDSGDTYDVTYQGAELERNLPHQVAFTVDTTAPKSDVWDIDGAVVSPNSVVNFIEDQLIDLVNGNNVRIGNANFGTNRIYDGGLGGIAGDAAITLNDDISTRWDSTNGVPTWPGRKCENWFSTQPAYWFLLPGSGFRRCRGTRFSGDMTEFGTGQPLSPRATWCV